MMKTEKELAEEIKKNWKKLSITFLLPNYSVYQSPDGFLQIGIHDLDNEIIGVKIVETDQMFLSERDVARILMTGHIPRGIGA